MPYDNYILDNVNILLNHDVTIIHGRQDIDCLLIGAYLLHKKLPNSKLFLIDAARHVTWQKFMKSTKKINIRLRKINHHSRGKKYLFLLFF
ncbi:hypothetical protein [Mycoplasmopsis cynos]|uniref:hypothetical protein n=1 Tax=Mycoplasmopsis cynos TaxID=171284 RepID=UPI002203C4B0|nr:hypothetical protein [Mycoplasmopsis cynos]UWV92614.1 hypothetical protein NWE57_00565 [Mycoplasmopsis cynos]